MDLITLEDKAGKTLVEFDGKVWTVFNQLESLDPVRLFHTTVEESPFYLFHELERFDDPDEILRKLSRKAEHLRAIFDSFFVERLRLDQRVVLIEKARSGVSDEFIDRISLSGNQDDGFIVDSTIEVDSSHNELQRNALGEVVTIIMSNVFDADDFIEAIDEITSDERWDASGWTWDEIISNLKKHYSALANEVYNSIGTGPRDNPRRIQNEFFYFKRIESYFNGNRFKLAIECANEGLEKFPFCSILYASRGEVYFSKGLVDEAIKDYEAAVDFGMETPGILVNTGLCYQVKHDHARAIDSFSAAIELDNKTTNAYLARAESYKALGRVELALQDEESAAETSAPSETGNHKTRCEVHNIELVENTIEKWGLFVSYPHEVHFFKRRLREVSLDLFPNYEIYFPGAAAIVREDEFSTTYRYFQCPKCVTLKDKWEAQNRDSILEEGREVYLREEQQSHEVFEKSIDSLLNEIRNRNTRLDSEQDATGSEKMVDPDSLKRESPTSRRLLITLVLFRLGYLSWIGAYILSVYESYFANSFWKTLVIAIPVLGQFLWAGVKFASVGVFNAYFYLLFVGLILVSPAYFWRDNKRESDFEKPKEAVDDTWETRDPELQIKFEEWVSSANRVLGSDDFLSDNEVELILSLSKADRKEEFLDFLIQLGKGPRNRSKSSD